MACGTSFWPFPLGVHGDAGRHTVYRPQARSDAERRNGLPNGAVGDSKVRVSLMGFNIIEHDWTNRILWDIYIYRWLLYVYTYMYLSNRNYLSVSKKGASNVYFYGNMMIHRWATWRLEDLDGKRPSFATFYNFTTHLLIHKIHQNTLFAFSPHFAQNGSQNSLVDPVVFVAMAKIARHYRVPATGRLACWGQDRWFTLVQLRILTGVNSDVGMGWMDWIWELRQGFDWNK